MRPNYKKAVRELMKILDKVEERRDKEGKPVKQKGQIVDVTEESLETAYQFTEHDLLVIKGNKKGANDGEL